MKINSLVMSSAYFVVPTGVEESLTVKREQ